VRESTILAVRAAGRAALGALVAVPQRAARIATTPTKRLTRGIAWCPTAQATKVYGSRLLEVRAMKGQQKPKQLAKKAPQKTLKEQRAAKKAKKKTGGY
jgi:hypothetical protein